MSNKPTAKQWMESKHWGGWRIGMVDGCGGIITTDGDQPWCGEHCFDRPPEGLPILSCYPPNLAYLLEDVRKAWGDEYLNPQRKCDFDNMLDIEPSREYWCLVTLVYEDGHVLDEPWHKGDTEAEALLSALMAAPGGVEALKEALGDDK